MEGIRLAGKKRIILFNTSQLIDSISNFLSGMESCLHEKIPYKSVAHSFR